MCSPKIDAKRAEEHHAQTGKVLHFGKRTRVDSHVSSGHHCTRVKETLEQDWSKFKCLSGHVWENRFLPLVLSIDENGEVTMHANWAHAVHNDGKGH